MKKKNKEDFVIDGKAKEANRPTTINEILGGTDFKYPYQTEDEYSEYLESLDDVSLKLEAIETAGLLPIDDTKVLKERLLNEYSSYLGSYRAQRREVRRVVDASKFSDKVKRILRAAS